MITLLVIILIAIVTLKHNNVNVEGAGCFLVVTGIIDYIAIAWILGVL